jgi:hypothetical protein
VHEALDLRDQEHFNRLELSMEHFGAKALEPLQVVHEIRYPGWRSPSQMHLSATCKSPLDLFKVPDVSSDFSILPSREQMMRCPMLRVD